MDFQGPLLGASVVQAIAAIPGAIKSLKDIFSREKPDATTALKFLNDLCKQITILGEIDGWLVEAKHLHQILQRLDDSLEGLRNEYMSAVQGGRFDFQTYRVANVRQVWLATQYRDLDKLLRLRSTFNAWNVTT